MTLQNFEQYISRGQLGKGLNYFKNGCVRELEEWETGIWNAIVSGSDDYHVKVNLKKGVIAKCSCDCPYDADDCKHIIAVLYALLEERGLAQVEKNDKKYTINKSKKKPAKHIVADTINKTSEKELRLFIIEYAATNREFRNMLQTHFAGVSGENGKHIYAETIINAAKIAAGRHGFIDYYKAKKAIQPVKVLLQKADTAFAEKHYAVVADIAFAIIENVHDIMTGMDDSDGAAGDCINEGFGLLLNLCEADIPFDLKERIFIDADKESKNPKYDYAGFDEHWLDVLVQAAYNPEKKMQLLQTLDAMLSNVSKKTDDNWSNEYHSKRLLAYKMTLLRKMQLNKEADDLRLRHIDIADFRMELIEEALVKEEYSKIKQLIATGITIAKKKGNPGTINSYKKTLLHVAEKQKDITAIRAIARELYAGRNMEYYRIMKSTYDAKEWALIAENLITELQKPDKTIRGFQGSVNTDALAAIFIEEKYSERLLNLIQNNPWLEFIENYSGLLFDKFPNELLAVYKEAIINYAVQNTGRNYYVIIRKILKKIQKWEGGKEVVKQLIIQFTLQYKSRKAMIEELGKLNV